jgi:putative salt-induced outer membrane protein YdiY
LLGEISISNTGKFNRLTERFAMAFIKIIVFGTGLGANLVKEKFEKEWGGGG